MQFIHQPLTWAFLLVLLPLLIHLINMMRHRHVKWAAMDFLLASYRKHRRWVWLKQLLLLATRMLAIAAIVAMLAKLVSQDQLRGWFGQRTTHHFVLVDDSLSMTDRAGGGSAFDRGRQLIQQLVASARQRREPQRMTMIRYSRAARVAEGSGVDTFADLNSVAVNAALAQAWDELEDRFRASQLAVGVAPALELADQLIEQTDDQRCVLHIVSDFRAGDWQQPSAIRDTLNRLSQEGTKIHLLRCVDQTHNNLSVTKLHPEIGTQAAGVPLMMTVQVRNDSPTAADQIRLQARSTFHPTSPQGTESAAQTSELPDLTIERLGPGEATTRQFQVYFGTPGHHVVEVELPADAVAADNRRWAVVELSSADSALIVDGDPEQKSAYYLESIFRPSGKARTGIMPTVQTPAYLRDATPEQLAQHQVIYLLDPSPLSPGTLDNLRTYVERGGGLAVFVGPSQDPSFYNAWYDSGVFPTRVAGPRAYSAALADSSADVQFSDHAVFRALTGQRNPFAAAIRIKQFTAIAPGGDESADKGVERLAQLRDGSPLILQRSLGSGHVVCFLTTLAPTWNNWALEPSFIVMALQLHAHLAQPQRPRDDRRVGDPIVVQLDAAGYQPNLVFEAPTLTEALMAEWEKVAESSPDEGSTLLTATLGGQPISPGETDAQGVYEARLNTRDNRPELRRFALNVDPRESDLTLLTSAELRTALEPVDVIVHEADDSLLLSAGGERNSWSEILFWVVLTGLLVEQLLAYRLSYHPSARPATGGMA